MRKFAMRAALVVVLLLVSPVSADERGSVVGQQVCRYLADYALVARALAEDPNVSVDQADAILGRIYLAANPAILGMQATIRAAARRDDRTARAFSGRFLQACLINQRVLEYSLGNQRETERPIEP